MRRIAEVYGYTPAQIGELTYDQLWVLSVDEKELKRKRTMTGTPEELKREGLIDDDKESVSLHDLLYPPKASLTKAQRRQRRQAAVAVARGEGQ